MQAIEEMTDNELDEAIALEVMGWHKVNISVRPDGQMWDWWDENDRARCPAQFWWPTVALPLAFDVINALRARDIYVYLDNEAGAGKWEISVFTDRKGEWNTEGCWDSRLADLERQPTVALAICRGALMAVRAL